MWRPYVDDVGLFFVEHVAEDAFLAGIPTPFGDAYRKGLAHGLIRERLAACTLVRCVSCNEGFDAPAAMEHLRASIGPGPTVELICIVCADKESPARHPSASWWRRWRKRASSQAVPQETAITAQQPAIASDTGPQ